MERERHPLEEQIEKATPDRLQEHDVGLFLQISDEINSTHKK
jgi:hypothetical protein